MNPRKWFRQSVSVASATVLFLSLNAWVMPVDGQSAALAVADSPSSVPSAPFVVARSFALASAPTGVAMGDLNLDGKLDLVAIDTVSGKATVFLGSGDGKFGAGTEYATGVHPTAVAIADLNGDGRQEVIVCDQAEGRVAVLVGSGDGRLAVQQNLALGIAPGLLAVGDFNGDGKADVVVASNSVLAILLNDGKGNLLKPISVALAKVSTALAVADFNRDGHADLALGNADGTISLLLGTGTGKFRSISEVGVGTGPLTSVAAIDFSRDGKPGLAVTESASGRVSVLLGNGDGTFQAAQYYSVGRAPVSVVGADFDGDGNVDLIAVNRGSNTFSVLGGNGDGTFKGAVDFVVGKSPIAAVAGDFDGDGRIDLALVNHDSESISLAMGNGDGTFKAARSYSAEVEPRAVASADLNGDKRLDLVVSNYCGSEPSCKGGTVEVFLAGEDRSYALAHSYPVGVGPVGLALVDVDGDGHSDIVALNREDKTISILLAKGDGSFQEAFTIPVAGAPVSVVFGDFDRDGRPDLAVLEDCGAAKCTQAGSVEVLLGQKDGGFQSAFVYPVGYGPSAIAVGDLNLDKTLDIVVANRCGRDAGCQSVGTASVLLGDGKGRFTAAPDVALGKSPASIALADLSGRGVLDLAVSRSADGAVAILRGKGDGTFASSVAYAVGNGPGPLAIADFNGDGKPDVAVASVADSTVSVLFGKGDGTLSPAIAMPVGMGPESLIAVAGKNGSRASLVTANGDSGAATPGREFTVLANVQPEVPPTATTISPTLPASLTINESIALSATVSASSGPAPAGGTVTFEILNAASVNLADHSCSSVPYTTGTWSCTTPASTSLVAGPYTVSAVYNPAPGAAFAASPTVTLPLTIGKLPVALGAIQTTPATLTVNGLTTFSTAIGSAGALTPIAPAETVAFAINGATPAACATVSAVAGTYTCKTTALVAPSDTITATYASGDPNYSVPDPVTLNLTNVAQQAATMTATSTPNPSKVNDSITFSATVTPTGAIPTTSPSGTVTFSYAQGTSTGTICTTPAVTKTVTTVSCASNKLAAGSYTVTATYTDTNFKAPVFTFAKQQVVQPAPATISLASTPSSSLVGGQVTFKATIGPVTTGLPFSPAGSVTFKINGNVPDGCSAVAVTNQSASCITAEYLNGPSEPVVATYAPDSNFSATPPANQSTITQNVGRTTPTVSLTGPTLTTSGSTATYTATVTASGAGITGVAPVSGTIAFSATPQIPGSSGNIFCTATLPVLTCKTPAVTVGTSGKYTITATYSPAASDKNYLTSTPSNPVTLTVGQSTASVTLASSATTTPTYGTAVTFTATVSNSASGSKQPTGSVVFTSEGGTALNCTNVTPNSDSIPLVPGTTSSTASCVYALLSGTVAGSPHTITATYGGDTEYKKGAFGTASQAVNPFLPTVTVTGSPSPSSYGQAVTLTATILGVAGVPGAAAPQGLTTSVAFTDGTTAITCTNPTYVPGSTSSVATCTTSALLGGTHNITASYTPTDPNYKTASTPATSAYPQTVNEVTPSVKVSASPAPSVVNQNVTFSATVAAPTSNFGGTKTPTGSVTISYSFTSNGKTQTVSPSQCSAIRIPSDSNSVSCVAPLPVASTGYTVSAAYIGDHNFTAGSGSGVQTVKQSETTLSLNPNGASVVATNSVTFTATIAPISTSPVSSGKTVPTGTIAFTSSDNSLNTCKAVPLSPANDGTVNAIATCLVTFPASDYGPVTISATYGATSGTSTVSIGDSNFFGSDGTATETVENFKVAFSPVGPIYISQGYSTAGAGVTNVDPFNKTPLSVTSNTQGPNGQSTGFDDTLQVTCVVTNSDNLLVSEPSCSNPSTKPGALAGNGTPPLPFVVSSSPATPVGSYTVTITATDSKFGTLSHTSTLQVNVGYVAGTLNLTDGSEGAVPVVFSTPANTSLTLSISCVNILLNGSPTTTSGITCSPTTATVSASNQQATIPITITAKARTNATTAQSKPTGMVAVAACIGVPLFALLGLLGKSRIPHRNFFRFLSLALLIAGLSSLGGCGGSFTPPPALTGGTPNGTYTIQVLATDTANPPNKYFAVVPLIVD